VSSSKKRREKKKERTHTRTIHLKPTDQYAKDITRKRVSLEEKGRKKIDPPPQFHLLFLKIHHII
jgi:hypothetical protein